MAGLVVGIHYGDGDDVHYTQAVDVHGVHDATHSTYDVRVLAALEAQSTREIARIDCFGQLFGQCGESQRRCH